MWRQFLEAWPPELLPRTSSRSTNSLASKSARLSVTPLTWRRIYLLPSGARMRILLDENFPLALVRRLREERREVDHIILLGLRGTPDAGIIDRLNSEDLLFLTHDQEFLALPFARSPVIVSRVTQSLPISVRVAIWLNAIHDYFSCDRHERLSKCSTTESYAHGRTSLPEPIDSCTS